MRSFGMTRGICDKAGSVLGDSTIQKGGHAQTVPVLEGTRTRRPSSSEPVERQDHHRRLSRERTVRIASAGVGFVLLLGVWYLVSLAVGVEVLPTPVIAAEGIGDYYRSGNLFSDLETTLVRMMLAFVLAFAIGLVVGVVLARSRWLELVFGSWVMIGASIPALLVMVISFLWIGLNDRAAIVGTALVVAPSIVFNVWQGMTSLQPELSEMGRAFGVPGQVILRRIMLPQTLPFLFAAARQGLSLTWKIVIFAELLGRSSGVGYRIQYWYQLFNMKEVLAAAIPFMVLMMVIEFGVLRPAERHLFRWRREEAR